MTENAIAATITGRVQGVAFRAWTQGQAEARGLRGWVRNQPDGSVRALIAGPQTALDDMIAALRQGPRAARVMRVEVASADPADAPAGFEISG